MQSAIRVVAFGAACVLAASCGDSAGSPTSPSKRTAQVGGVWAITETINSVTGGECFSGMFQSTIGSVGRGTMQVSQTGDSLTATVTDDRTGGSCNYTGTAGESSISLNVVSCTASDLIGAQCPGSNSKRDERLQTGGINGNISGSTATGTAAQSYNVVIAGTGTPMGSLILNSSFAATRR